jgi:hypothetical protein
MASFGRWMSMCSAIKSTLLDINENSSKGQGPAQRTCQKTHASDYPKSNFRVSETVGRFDTENLAIPYRILT